MNKWWNKLLAFLLLISLVLNGIIILRFNNVTEDVGRNYEKLNYLERSVSNLSSDLNKVASKQDWVSSKDYKILEIDKDYKNVQIMIYGNLKELENNAKVYLLYGKIKKDSPEDIEWIKVPINVSYGLKFSKKLELPYKENYKFKILAEGQSKLRSEDLLYAYFKEELENRVFTHVFSNESSKDSLKLDININNNYKAQDKLKIKDVKVNVYVDNNLNKSIQVYSNGKVVENKSIMEVKERSNSEDSVEDQDTNIEKLNYSIKIKKDFKETSNVKYEVVIEDYIGEKFKEEHASTR
ncbi:hypothetical protein [Clostridium sp. JNZ J1-5]